MSCPLIDIAGCVSIMSSRICPIHNLPSIGAARKGNSKPQKASNLKKQRLHIASGVSKAFSALDLTVDRLGVVRFPFNSRSHPRQWGLFRKVFNTGLICFAESFMTVILTAESSIAPFVAPDLGTTLRA